MSVVPRAQSGVRYFCYLLTSNDPKYKNHTYVGFTVNPKRRIRQHNGELTNGAKRTTRKRPWEMVVTVHGFPNKTLALQFEWILQHPRDSKRFRDVASNLKKLGNLFFLKAKLRFMMEMLHIAPFHMLPLTVHWFTDKYKHLLVDCPSLPAHIRANMGPLEELATDDFIDSDEDQEVESNSDMSETELDCDEEQARDVITLRCAVCEDTIDPTGSVARCVHAGCNMAAHLTCLSKDFLRDSSNLLPVTGECRGCNQQLHWGDVIKKMKHKGKALKRSTEDRQPLRAIDSNVPEKVPKKPKSKSAKKPAAKNNKKDDAVGAPSDEERITPNLPTTPVKKYSKKTKANTTTSSLPASTTAKSSASTYNSTTRISTTNFTASTSSINLTSNPTTRSTNNYTSTTSNQTTTTASTLSSSYRTSSTLSQHISNSPPTTKPQKPKDNLGFSVGGLDELYSSDESEAIKLDSRINSKSRIETTKPAPMPNNKKQPVYITL